MMHRSFFSIFFLILLAPAFGDAAEATLRVTPESGGYAVGESFSLQVVVDSDTAITAAEAEVAFDPAIFSLESISRAGSILSSWSTPPEISNETGRIRFAGWSGEQFSGTDGHLLSLNFRALKAGDAKIELASGSVLAADGRGSNIIGHLGQSAIKLTEARSASTFVPAEEEVPQVLGAEAPVPAPEFFAYEPLLTAGEPLYVRGRVRPNGAVSVWIRKGDASEVESILRANEEGEFTFAFTETEAGVYRVWATENTENARGDVSERLTITVREKNVALLASSGLLSISAVIVAAFFALVVCVNVGIRVVRNRRL